MMEKIKGIPLEKVVEAIREEIKKENKKEAIKWVHEDIKTLNDTSTDILFRAHKIMENWRGRLDISWEDLK